MSVRKFRSVEEMAGPPALPPLDPNNLRLACALSRFARSLHPSLLRPGVTKYRSAEEAARPRDERE